MRAIAVEHGVEVTVILVDVPARVATERWRRNRETGQRSDVRDDDFIYAVQSFEPPAPGEHALRYDQSLPLDDWLRAHFGNE